MKRFFFSLALVLALLPSGILSAGPALQDEPTMIAVFPMKNQSSDVRYDSLAWSYADSLVAYLNTQQGAGTTFTLLPMNDLRDQMLALNVDPRSPSYETDVFRIVKALGAKKVVWGIYKVKYEKVDVELKIIDARTLMPDKKHIADKVRSLYTEALSTVTSAGDRLLGGLH